MGAMTLLQSRPIRRVKPTPETPNRPGVLAAAVAAACTAGAGLVIGLVAAVAAWFAVDTGSFTGAVRVGALAWLVAQGGGLHVGGVAVTAIPLGGCLVAGGFLYRSGRWVGANSAVRSLASAASAAVALTLAYALIGVVVYAVTRSGGGHADLMRTLVATVVLPAGFGTAGIIRGAGLSDAFLRPVPQEARAVIRGAVAGVSSLFAASAVVFGASFVVHFSDVSRLSDGLSTGVVGGIILIAICVALIPNAVLCAGSYLAGPGYLLGTGTMVTASSVQLGSLPSLPILAATPHSGGAWWQEALLVVPVAAGGVAGIVALRRHRVEGHGAAAMRSAVAGLVAGLGFGATTWLATGALGPGRMRDIGPDWLATTTLCAVAFTIGSLAAGLAWTWWTARSAAPSDESAGADAY
jgi:hypothetical protein